jgi:glutaconyl-CoA decarboxylase
MRSFRVNISGHTYTVEVEDINQSPIQVRINGKPYAVKVEWQGADSEATVRPEIVPSAEVEGGPPTPRPPQAPVPPVSENERAATATIEAPMPGTIMSLGVQAGDTVMKGDEICTLEAMKMRNSIKSPRAGRIAEVLVAAGSKVAYGQALVRFYPE